MWRAAAVALIGLLALAGAALPTWAADDGAEAHGIERQDWTFGGFTGQYDKAQLQRGFQVFQQVCTACHGLKRVRFRNLAEPGGPEFPEAAVKALAVSWPYQISGELDDQGNPIDRLPGLADSIIGPYKNDKQARAAQNGALPPDLSLIAKARSVESHAGWYSQWFYMLRDMAAGYQEGGADYLYALLTGYHEPPAGMQMTEGMNYNAAFPGHQLAMPPPLSKDNVVEYQPESGYKGSLEQNAHDVTAFLAWAADPHLDRRKQLGWQVLLYLAITTVLLYLVKRRTWARVKH
jgi:ubiquinol-cytochrome c reductase cytochrome c1 subunit